MKTILHSDVTHLRAQVLLIVGTCATVLVALWTFVLLPLRDEARSSKEEMQNLESELAAFAMRFEHTDLPQRLSVAAARQRHLTAEWTRLRERVDTFRDRDAILEALPTYEDGRIDFKVALYEARQKLVNSAASANVQLPADLGIPEAIGTEERAELRGWQLAATVRLVGLAIDARVPVIGFIESEPPVVCPLDESESQVAIEFPTHMVLRCSFKHLTSLLDMLSRERSFYAVRSIRIERMGYPGAEMLEVDVEAGAILFQSRNGTTDLIGPDRQEPVQGRRIHHPMVNGRERRHG
ncbi:MAG: hypothetical protein HQ523_14800 [Lentisphaerae bacterium]|nr:hypothetical protein [Lentisphaerota bacterium]